MPKLHRSAGLIYTGRCLTPINHFSEIVLSYYHYKYAVMSAKLGISARKVLVLTSVALIILSTVSIPANTHAAKGFVVTVKTDKHHYSAGDTVKITVNVKGLNKQEVSNAQSSQTCITQSCTTIVSVQVFNGVTTEDVATSGNTQSPKPGVIVISYTLPSGISSSASSEGGATQIVYSVLAMVSVPGYEVQTASTTFTVE